jgi:hypothetical protein
MLAASTSLPDNSPVVWLPLLLQSTINRSTPCPNIIKRPMPRALSFFWQIDHHMADAPVVLADSNQVALEGRLAQDRSSQRGYKGGSFSSSLRNSTLTSLVSSEGVSVWHMESCSSTQCSGVVRV